MTDYYIDILEPIADLNEAMDSLGKAVGALYHESWDKNKRHLYGDQPFNLNINSFASLWYSKNMKVFVVRDTKTQETLGFLTGILVRPLPYEAMIFQIQEWYTRGDKAMEKALIDHVIGSIRVLGCDEIWVQYYTGQSNVDVGPAWENQGDFTIRRYTKKR